MEVHPGTSPYARRRANARSQKSPRRAPVRCPLPADCTTARHQPGARHPLGPHPEARGRSPRLEGGEETWKETMTRVRNASREGEAVPIHWMSSPRRRGPSKRCIASMAMPVVTGCPLGGGHDKGSARERAEGEPDHVPITSRSPKCAAIRIVSDREVMLQLNGSGECACYRILCRKSRGGNTKRRGRPCAH
jgi:hypothetical protein